MITTHPVTRKLGVALATLGMLALVAGPSVASGPDAATRKSVPKWELEDLDGDLIRSTDLVGKVVVISFWATWCVPCKQELNLLQKQFAKREGDGLVIIGVATDGPETFSKIRGTVKKHKWTFPVLPDREGRVTGLLNPRGATPYSMYIDRAGLLAYDHEGFSQGDEPTVIAHIDELLAEKGK